MSEEKAEKKARRKYRDDTWTEEQVTAQRAKLTVEEVPAGWVKLAEISNLCRAEGIAVSKLVRSTGGDRGMNPPLDPVFQIKYVGHTRYLSGEVKTKGMKLLKDAEFAKTKRKPRAKKEGSEKAPVKKTTKKKVSVVAK